MKALFAILLVAGTICGTPAFARSSAASPLLGSWAVDVSRLPMMRTNYFTRVGTNSDN